MKDRSDSTTRQFSTWNALIQSWYNRVFYRDVALAWRGTGLGYLFLLVFFLSALTCIALHGDLQKSLRFDLPAILEQLPELEFSKGALHSREPRRYLITHKPSGRLLIVIDTSIEKPETIQTQAPVFIVGHQKIWLQAGPLKSPSEFINLHDVEALNVAKLDPLIIDAQLMREIIQTTAHWVMPVIFPFFVLMSYASRLIEALLFAWVAYFILRSARRFVNYASLLRLIIVAQTPSLLMAMLAVIVRQAAGYLTWIAIAFSAYYTVFSVYAAFFSSEEEKNTPSGPGDNFEELF